MHRAAVNGNGVDSKLLELGAYKVGKRDHDRKENKQEERDAAFADVTGES